MTSGASRLPVRQVGHLIYGYTLYSAAHTIRIYAIWGKNRAVLAVMGALFAVQIVVTAVCCGFFRCELDLQPIIIRTCLTSHVFSSAVPLEEGQGCIAGPKANWVGIYWLSITLLYTASVGLFCDACCRLQCSPILRPYSR